ncbi:MAG: RNHCP domain-containing protein [Chloroflexota bacterium]|nr:MAG: RNHCP domain-containing protein [Chloroflexota bacterium]
MSNCRHVRRQQSDDFRCKRCKMMVGPVVYGGHNRNHCPFCLWSRHVDGRVPGDRASTCGSMMMPIGVFVRPKGEHTIVHRCLGCEFERHNRIAADDFFDRVLALPPVAARGLVPAASTRREPAA